MTKKQKNLIIITSIITCLISIFIYKKYEIKNLNTGLIDGFEYYTNSKYKIDEDLKSGYPFILILGSDMCKSCTELEPITKKLNKKLQGEVKVKYVDILENKNIKEKFKPRVTPTIYFADSKGVVTYFIEGVTTENEILLTLEKLGVDTNE